MFSYSVTTIILTACLTPKLVRVHVLMRDEMEERKKQAESNNKAKQHSTPKAVTFPKKNELPRVGLEPTTLYTLDRALYQATCT